MLDLEVIFDEDRAVGGAVPETERVPVAVSLVPDKAEPVEMIDRARVGHEPDPDEPASTGPLRWIAEGCPMHQPDPPATDFGGPAGWTVRSWCERLRQLASVCEFLHPEIAARHRGEADRIECAAQNSAGARHER